jgi:hypothetical protein
MTAAYLFLSFLAALGFYLSSAHQQLLPATRVRAFRAGAWAGTIAALAVAILRQGVWAGVFSALTALMLALVLLPYADAALQLRKRESA